MRVVFLTHNYPRWPGDVSGAFLATLATALGRRGIEVRVLAPSDEGQGGSDDHGPVSVRRVRYASPGQERIAYRGTMSRALRSPGGLKALAGLWRALRQAADEEVALGAQLVHAHWWIPGGLAAPAGAPLVLTSHGTDASLLRHSGLARRLARPVYARASVVTAVSREMATWIENGVGRHIAKHHVQAMPIDTSGYDWSEGGGGAYVVARLSRQKRVDLAIRTISFLETLGAALPLTIVGDGPERAALESLAVELGVSRRVRFLGAVKPSEIPAVLRTADLMYFPAAGEGFGLSAAEALMCGVPVIACWDGGGVLDVVPETGAGRRVIPSPDALADATLDILTDEGRVAQARELGQFWRRRLDPDHVAGICAAWYDEALEAAPVA
ncbi:MAG TPA: glycosyltransferase family 4 protein [Gemmatimonadales bacterium]|nr:glycosyltransferase family 4 protein [Gemmatimonadales bacterium]